MHGAAVSAYAFNKQYDEPILDRYFCGGGEYFGICGGVFIMTDLIVRHTPGPWAKNRYGELCGSDHKRITLSDSGISLSCGVPQPEYIANARLVAAAPDLLEALKAVVSVADRKTVEFDKAHAAIAKAEGKAL